VSRGYLDGLCQIILGPDKLSVSTEETCVLCLSSFLIFKIFSRRTIKARNIEIDEGKEEFPFPFHALAPGRPSPAGGGLYDEEAAVARGGKVSRCGGLPTRAARR
jgi:hypothetical protein